MGTLRWEKEAEEKARALQRAESAHKRRELQFAEADASARITALQLDLERQRADLALYTRDDAARHLSSGERQNELRRLRGANGADTATPCPDVERRAPRRALAGKATARSEHAVASKRKKNGAAKEAVTTVVVMRLYIAGGRPTR